MPPVKPKRLLELLYGADGPGRRFTQDSPILPEVWFAYAENPRRRCGLLLTPHADARASELARALREGLPAEARVASTNTYVYASLTFRELVEHALPLSGWWRDVYASRPDEQLEWHGWTREREAAREWFRSCVEEVARRPLDEPDPARETLLFKVNLNRPARVTLTRSAGAVKADAARRLFVPSCSHLRWAVIDSGVDAEHPAFRRRRGETLLDSPFERFDTDSDRLATRVWRTWDFTRVREVLTPDPAAGGKVDLAVDDPVQQLHQRLLAGQAVDWDLVSRDLEMRHDDDGYAAPLNDHGTHVAGILGADWRAADGPQAPPQDLIGICPDIEIADLRVFGADGTGDEFGILAALQFVRHLNARSEQRVIHGVNLSMALDHDVENYACGRTPVCEEVERLIGTGVVVVASAGNEGWTTYVNSEGQASQGYRTVSITDPGNAYGAITVGSTHRSAPHTYGVSFFSSRGPTGDGRLKPDLVAPGEKIVSTVPGRGRAAKDGTSMAAPHVSGAAALLMARHDELVGQPADIKALLCRTATDLGRERYFQGAGMLDVLRAMQAH